MSVVNSELIVIDFAHVLFFNDGTNGDLIIVFVLSLNNDGLFGVWKYVSNTMSAMVFPFRILYHIVSITVIDF